MQQFINSIMAAISFLSVSVYDFLCLCRILKWEGLVEKIWQYLFPNKPYNELHTFLLIRPIFLWVSFLTYILSGGLASQVLIYRIMLMATIPLSVGVVIRNLKN